jgi:hypothetical protein
MPLLNRDVTHTFVINVVARRIRSRASEVSMCWWSPLNSRGHLSFSKIPDTEANGKILF